MHVHAISRCIKHGVGSPHVTAGKNYTSGQLWLAMECVCNENNAASATVATCHSDHTLMTGRE